LTLLPSALWDVPPFACRSFTKLVKNACSALLELLDASAVAELPVAAVPDVPPSADVPLTAVDARPSRSPINLVNVALRFDRSFEDAPDVEPEPAVAEDAWPLAKFETSDCSALMMRSWPYAPVPPLADVVAAAVSPASAESAAAEDEDVAPEPLDPPD